MKKSTLVFGAVALAVSSNMALAAKAAPSFIDSLDKSFAITSNYVFRGQTVSFGSPAVQGGVTYNHESGLSVDFWLSSSASAFVSNEYDVTVKYSGKTKDFAYEAGVVSYHYPQDALGSIPSSHEFFAGMNVKNLNASIFINPDDAFGDNTYIELSADINKFNIALGINSNDAPANDYNQITATVALNNNLSLAVSQSDADFDDTQLALTYEMAIK